MTDEPALHSNKVKEPSVLPDDETRRIAEKIQQLEEELATARLEYLRVRQSLSYQLGQLLVHAFRSPGKLLRLPVDMARVVIKTRAARREAPQLQYKQIEKQLQRFFLGLTNQPSSSFVFMFSGTVQLQNTRGNRPIRLARALLKAGTPVLFNYHRWRRDDPLPSRGNGVFQVPIDYTLANIDKIARAHIPFGYKIFVISYPHPGIVNSIALFKENSWKVIYDCRDDWEEFSKVDMASWYTKAAERAVVLQSSVITCVSRPLKEKIQRFAPQKRVVVSPNAVEDDFVPADYAHKPQTSPRIVGYFGHLSDAWFDWDAIEKIAEKRPQLIFEFIGHSEPPGLVLPENVKLLGPKSRHELPEIASRWSCAIIPFKMNRLADAVDPIKIYEYLSLGLPTVSFRMPQISDYPYTWIAETVDEFCMALDESMSTQVDEQKISEFIARNTWEVRAQELLDLATGAQSSDE